MRTRAGQSAFSVRGSEQGARVDTPKQWELCWGSHPGREAAAGLRGPRPRAPPALAPAKPGSVGIFLWGSVGHAPLAIRVPLPGPWGPGLAPWPWPVGLFYEQRAPGWNVSPREGTAGLTAQHRGGAGAGGLPGGRNPKSGLDPFQAQAASASAPSPATWQSPGPGRARGSALRWLPIHF